MIDQSKVPVPFVLDLNEKTTGLWPRLEQHLQERLQTLRMKNDGDLEERDTARIRGQIAEVKRLLSLSEDAPKID